ncbi:hypothetical protein [Bacillus nitratireducens]|uniref:hypothetical protein n=1 Tax=Bacillus nitratireducens TaxID=2026193 RepID=UPI00399CD9AD
MEDVDANVEIVTNVVARRNQNVIVTNVVAKKNRNVIVTNVAVKRNRNAIASVKNVIVNMKVSKNDK